MATKPDTSREAEEALANPSPGFAEAPAVKPPPALTPSSLEIDPEGVNEPYEGPRYSGYASKLMSPRRRKTQAKNKRRRLTRKQLQKRRIQILVSSFVAALAVWVTVTATRTHVEPLVVLTLQDIPHSAALLGVTARPPSLFVEVDSRSWERLQSTERIGLVEQVGATAKAAGYSGALFRTAQGVSVAQWLKTSGVLLVERSTESAS